MNKSHTMIARWKFWQFALSILIALTLSANALAAPLDSSGDLNNNSDNDGNALSFAQGTYNLTVSSTGSGSVSREPAQSTYLAGTFVTLTATAAEGFTFSGWTGDCLGTGICTVTMDSDLNVSATFTLISGPGNDAPSFSSTPGLTATVGDLYTYFVAASDPDSGDHLTFSARAKPDWLTLVPTGDGTAMLSGTPDWSDLGAHIMRLQVQDTSGAFATQEFILIVNAPEAATTGSIQGMVLDADGNGIGGAMVTRATSDSEVASTSVQNQITDNNGSYRFEAVPPGDYTIIVTLNDQAPDALIAVKVLPGELAEIPAVTLQAGRQSLHLPLLYK